MLSASIEVLTRFMDVAALRHQVVANNIANVNTPQFKALIVDFEKAAEQAIKTPGSDLKGVTAEVRVDPNAPVRRDGNTVDIDQEMARLHKNNIMFRTYAQLLAGEVNMMRSAIAGR
ncbi:MAG: flagellar basal body protein [Gemmataceae bacterium]|nr:flagellar basal body protein [Gemmataceae bacterium]